MQLTLNRAGELRMVRSMRLEAESRVVDKHVLAMQMFRGHEGTIAKWRAQRDTKKKIQKSRRR